MNVQLDKLVEKSPGAMLVVEASGIIRHANSAAHTLFEYPGSSLVSAHIDQLIPVEYRAAHANNMRSFFAHNSTATMRGGKEFSILLKSGKTAPANIEITPIVVDGAYVALVSVVDISVYKEQQRELTRINRAMRFLSSCNRLLMRATNESELLNSICQVALIEGGYLMAWVGEASSDDEKRVIPKTRAGDIEKYLDEVKITWNDDEFGRGPTGTCIREERIVTSRFIASDPDFKPWRDQALSRGYQSTIALPLRVHAQIFGSLTLYAAEPDAFDEREFQLLKEVADDLAFGIETLRTRDEHAKATQKLTFLAYTDSLTGLPNRAYLIENLEEDIKCGTQGFLLAVDLVNFKDINDTYGYLVGDTLLANVARILESLRKEGDVLTRVGGDEFIYKCNNIDKMEAEHFANEIAETFVAPIRFNGQEFQLGTRIGIERFPLVEVRAHTIISHAGLASRSNLGSEREINFYSVEMDNRLKNRVDLVRDLKKAIDNHELFLHYQPKVALPNGELSGAEALLRWHPPARGPVSPGEFIPVAENSGIMPLLGHWVLRESCRQIMEWKEFGHRFPGRLSVNVSARQFADSNFLAKLHEILQEFPGIATELELEITESAFAEDIRSVAKIIESIRNLDITVVIDDFGTRFSSLSYLTRLPVHGLKIDISFVQNMFTSKRDYAIVNTIVGIAKNLEFSTTAEGVETLEQVNALHALGCHHAQGFLYGRAIPAAEFAINWLKK